MRVVKTGLRWKDHASGLMHTGDLFVSDDKFYLRGVPIAAFSESGREPAILPNYITPHATIATSGWDVSGVYLNSQGPVELLTVSEKLREHFAEWYPELSHMLNVSVGG